MTHSELDQIGLRSGTDKSSVHHDFLRHYERAFRARRTPTRSILEIGVYNGDSLRMWSEFFPEANILGLDIDPRCLSYATGRVRVELCDQTDPHQLIEVARRHGPFDAIIDDGSHVWSHQILTFETLFPFVAKDGLFIIEDIDTSFGHYVAEYGRESTQSAAEYVNKLANYVLGSTAAPLGQEPDLRVRAFVARIDSITFIRRSAIIALKP